MPLPAVVHPCGSAFSLSVGGFWRQYEKKAQPMCINPTTAGGALRIRLNLS
jgi:hypothetical protein